MYLKVKELAVNICTHKSYYRGEQMSVDIISIIARDLQTLWFHVAEKASICQFTVFSSGLYCQIL